MRAISVISLIEILSFVTPSLSGQALSRISHLWHLPAGSLSGHYWCPLLNCVRVRVCELRVCVWVCVDKASLCYKFHVISSKILIIFPTATNITNTSQTPLSPSPSHSLSLARAPSFSPDVQPWTTMQILWTVATGHHCHVSQLQSLLTVQGSSRSISWWDHYGSAGSHHLLFGGNANIS